MKSPFLATQKDNIGSKHNNTELQPKQPYHALLLNALITESDRQRELYHQSVAMVERAKQQILLVGILQYSLSQPSQQQQPQSLQQPFIPANPIQDDIILSATTANSRTGTFNTINVPSQQPQQPLPQPFLSANPIQESIAKAESDMMTKTSICNTLYPLQQKVKTNMDVAFIRFEFDWTRLGTGLGGLDPRLHSIRLRLIKCI